MGDSSRRFTFRDMVVTTLIVLMLSAFALRCIARSSSGSGRITCSSRLKQIGLAVQIYANDNKGSFPRTLFDLTDDPVPTEYTGVNAPNPFGPGGPSANDVTAPLYNLLRAGDIKPEVFVCPYAVQASPFDLPAGTTERSFSNFAGRANLSYGYTNPYPSTAARANGYKLNFTLSSDFAIAADMGLATATNVASNAPRPQMVAGNSPNHAGDGQNVLYADGHVDWSATMYAGSPRQTTGGTVLRDNIFAFGADTDISKPSAGSHGAPVDQFDSVILPTFELGPQPGPIVAGAMSAAPAPPTSGLAVAGVVALLMATGIAVGIALKRFRRRRMVASAPEQAVG